MRRLASANAKSSFIRGNFQCRSDEAAKLEEHHLPVVSFLPSGKHIPATQATLGLDEPRSSQYCQHSPSFRSLNCCNSGGGGSCRAPGAMACSPLRATPGVEPQSEHNGVYGGGGGEAPPQISVDANGSPEASAMESATSPAEKRRERGRLTEEERNSERKMISEKKAAQSRAYEERWQEWCVRETIEETFSGWKQLLPDEEYGGWAYGEGSGGAAAALESSWKRSLRLPAEHEERDFRGWDEPASGGGEETPLGGWLYAGGLHRRTLDDYQTEVEILGKKVMVTVATKGATVERWLEGRMEEEKWGLDIEWRPTFQKGDYHFAALLQLSLEECCLLIQLQFMDVLPESLKSLLADPKIMMGGVGIKADTSKLRKDFNLVCAGEVELTTLAISKFKNPSLKKSGIARLTGVVLGVPYKKNKRATMSNWENCELTFAQIQYAAADAWLSYSILIGLLNFEAQPAVPGVVHSGESSITRVQESSGLL